MEILLEMTAVLQPVKFMKQDGYVIHPVSSAKNYAAMGLLKLQLVNGVMMEIMPMAMAALVLVKWRTDMFVQEEAEYVF